MKMFFVYNASDRKMIGRVYAETWYDALTQASMFYKIQYRQIFVSEMVI